MDKKTKDKKDSKSKSFGTYLVIGMAIIHILLGFGLLLVPQISIVEIAYLLSVLCVVIGIILIVKYFLAEAFKNINQYGFSVGVLFVILGMCALVRAKDVSRYFILCMGILVLFTAIILLQNSLDLKALQDKSFSIILVVAIVISICAVIIIINPFSTLEDLEYFTYIILIADGALSLIITFYLSIRIKRYKKYHSKIDQKVETDIMESNQESSIMEDKSEDIIPDVIEEESVD